MTKDDDIIQETQSMDSRAKFREALEKKRRRSSSPGKNIQGGPKISGGKSGGNAPKMFRRKSGSE